MSNFKHKEYDYVQKSAYVISLISYEDIIRLGGKYIIENEIYNIPRQSTNETVALLAISTQTLTTILLNTNIYNDNNIYNCNCKYIESIRSFSDFSYIDDIHKLYIKYSYIIQRIIQSLINEGWQDQFILCNIEPKGKGFLEKRYPAPLISIPGGTMEKSDNNDFEVCAFREFFEETMINIDKCGYLTVTKDKLKCNKYYKKEKTKNKYEQYDKCLKISWYYSIKLLYPEFNALLCTPHESNKVTEI